MLQVTGNYSNGVLSLSMQTADDNPVVVEVVPAPFNLSLPAPVSAFPGPGWAVPSTATRTLAGALRNVNLILASIRVGSHSPPHYNTQSKPWPERRYIDEVLPAQLISQQVRRGRPWCRARARADGPRTPHGAAARRSATRAGRERDGGIAALALSSPRSESAAVP